jgi:MFS family permease
MDNKSRFFVASCIALVVTAMSFAIRGDIMPALGAQFSLTKEQLGWIAGTAFWGFTLAMVFGGPLCDVVGMGRLIIGAFVGHVAGILLTIFAVDFWTLYFGTLLIGIGNGLVEAACNPLIATIYPDNKTEKLNHFHVWFSGGIVIGGLLAYGLTQFAPSLQLSAKLTWQVKMAAMLLPALVYGAMFLGQRFPRTERVQSGVTTGEMFKECLRPLFILLVFCMLLTAASELGPGQWIPDILTTSAAVSGILVLVWINGLMALGRQFAGPVVHRLSPTGVLVMSALLAGLGLLGLSYVRTNMFGEGDNQTLVTIAAFAIATVYALGVCYFWPTMLGVTSERVPRSGRWVWRSWAARACCQYR